MNTTMELPLARPYCFKFRPESTALLIIDMQRDFLDPNGVGAVQGGNDDIFRSVREIVPETKRVLEAARRLGLHVVHTREGHRPDLPRLQRERSAVGVVRRLRLHDHRRALDHRGVERVEGHP